MFVIPFPDCVSCGWREWGGLERDGDIVGQWEWVSWLVGVLIWMLGYLMDGWRILG